MKISIYQIVLERDVHHVAFLDQTAFTSVYGGEFPSHLYEQVFSGEVEAQSLEEVFRRFNIEYPEGYCGRSMSVSDVVEVCSPSGGSKFFLCDPIGFTEIVFYLQKATLTQGG